MEIKTYADYDEALSWILADECGDEEVERQLAELEAEYPAFAKQQHAERDARRALNDASCPVREPAEEISVDGQIESGKVIEVDGVKYVTEQPFYISPEESAFLDEVHDRNTPPGWYTSARRQ